MKTKLNWPLVVLVTFLLALAGCQSDSSSGAAVAGDSAIFNGDDDGDGIRNGDDNCVLIPNPGQEDLDGDGLGDVCDSDRDGDGIDDSVDDCPADPNNAPGCETNGDDDGDGIINGDDNCRFDFNPGQEDGDGDGIGDACDDNTDTDGDGVQDTEDNCPDTANAPQTDTDGDGIGDACDPVDNTGDDAYACGTAAAAPYKPFQEPAASASGTESFLCVEGCVVNAGNVVDSNLLNSATLQSTLLGGATLTVTDAVETYEAPNKLGVAIADADALLSISLLSTIDVTTRLDGAVQETFSDLTLAELDLLGMINDESVGFLVFDTAADFDEVAISLGGVNVLESIDVFAVCASPDAL